MSWNLSNKTVMLTGAGGILGQRFVAALLSAGARVVAVERNPDALTVLRTQYAETGRLVEAAVDVTHRDDLVDLRQQLKAADIGVDVLVNNAATKSKNFFTPFADFPVADWNEVMTVNLTGAMLCCQVFGSQMAARGSGSIINMLSIYGISAPDQRIYEDSEYEGRPINTPAVYSASKAGLWGLTQYLAAYWGGQGVRVNAVTPGGVYSGQNDVFRERYSARVPLARMAAPEELCGAVVFLASEDASYITGHNLVVDGGLTVW